MEMDFPIFPPNLPRDASIEVLPNLLQFCHLKKINQWILIQRKLGPKVTDFPDVEDNLRKERSLRDFQNVIHFHDIKFLPKVMG